MRAPILLLLSLAVACVPRAEHELIEVQLDATRMALNAGNAAHFKGVEALEAQLAAAETALARAAQTEADLNERLAAMEAEVQAARADLARVSQLESSKDAELEPLVAAMKARLMDALAVQAEQEQHLAHAATTHAKWVERFAALQAKGDLEVLQDGDQTVIRIPTRKLLNEGRMTMSPRGRELVSAMAVGLKSQVDLDLLITAHTDDRPYHDTEHHSSWELGFGQSMSMLRALTGEGVTARMQSASAAGTRPIAPNDTDEGRKLNQRIELTILPSVPPEPAPPEDAPSPDAEGTPAAP